MNRSLLNQLIDLLAAIGLLVMVLTGLILRFALPPGTNRTHLLWGLSRHEWGSVHTWASLALLVLLTFHVALHWDWVCSVVRRRLGRTGRGSPLRAGFVAAIVVAALLGLFLWAARSGVQELEHPRHASFDAPPSTPGFQAEALGLAREVSVVFGSSCLRCHGPEQQAGGFRVDQSEAFFNPKSQPPLVVPGHSGASRLVAIVSGEVEMKSRKAHILPARELALVRAWIDLGAPWPSATPTAAAP